MIRELVGGIYFWGERRRYCYGYENTRVTIVFIPKSRYVRLAKIAFDEARRLDVKMTHVPQIQCVGRRLGFGMRLSKIWQKNTTMSNTCRLSSIMRLFNSSEIPGNSMGLCFWKNMQGDILTDQAGGLTRLSRFDAFGVYGARKGLCGNRRTARHPISRGQNIANPYSMIGSIAFFAG